MPSVHDLPFVAPIPRGHEVLLVTFTVDNQSPTLVLDRTTSIVYCPENLWGPLHQDPVLAVSDPIAAVTRFAWTVRNTVAGTCVGALISTQNSGNKQEAKTRMLIEPATAPYR